MNFTHHKHAHKIIALTICMYATFTHGMEKNNAQKRILQAMYYDDQDKSVALNFNDSNEVDYTIAKLAASEEKALLRQIKIRRLCNVAFKVATLSMLAKDIVNSYWYQEGLSVDNNKPRAVNDMITLWRTFASILSLYELSHLQEMLDKQLITTDNHMTAAIWRNAHCCAAGITGLATIIAAPVTGLQHYPFSLAMWGVNMAFDAFATLNWQKNMDLCDKIMQQEKKQL